MTNDNPPSFAWVWTIVAVFGVAIMFAVATKINQELTEVRGEAVKRGHAEWKPDASGAPEFKWIDRK
jgi:hypothetical protein